MGIENVLKTSAPGTVSRDCSREPRKPQSAANQRTSERGPDSAFIHRPSPSPVAAGLVNQPAIRVTQSPSHSLDRPPVHALSLGLVPCHPSTHATRPEEIVSSVRPAPGPPARLRRVQGMFQPMWSSALTPVDFSYSSPASQTQGTRFPAISFQIRLLIRPIPQSAQKQSLVTRAAVAAASQYVPMVLSNLEGVLGQCRLHSYSLHSKLIHLFYPPKSASFSVTRKNSMTKSKSSAVVSNNLKVL